MNPARDDEFRRPVSRWTASRSATSPAAFEPAAVADRDDTDETLVFVAGVTLRRCRLEGRHLSRVRRAAHDLDQPSALRANGKPEARQD